MSTAQTGVRIAPSPFARDVLMSGATAVLTMLSLVLVTGWLASGLGPAAFAVYALSRRVLSAIASITPGPMGIALPRAVAAAPDSRARDAYLWAATLLTVGPALAIVAIGAAAPGRWAELLLSDSRYAPEFLAVLVLILGNVVYSLVFARLRGVFEIRSANLWQLWVMAVGPVLVVGLLATSAPVVTILLLLAAVSLTALGPLLGWLVAAVRRGIRRADLPQPARELFRYTAPRIPGAAALACLLALAPLLAPYLADLRHAGYLVAAQSVFRVAEVGTAGFGLVVLPKVSALQAQRQDHFLHDRVADLVGLVLHLGLFVTCQLVIWAPEIVHVWLGPEYREAVLLVRLLLIALMPYLGYTLLRSVIDGIEERPVNVWNLYASLACTVLLTIGFGLAGFGATGLAMATAAGFTVLGALTLRYLWRSLHFDWTPIHAGGALVLNAIIAAAALLARSFLADRLGPGATLAAGVGLGGLLLLGYLLALRRLEVRWLVEIESRLLRRQGGRR